MARKKAVAKVDVDVTVDAPAAPEPEPVAKPAAKKAAKKTTEAVYVTKANIMSLKERGKKVPKGTEVTLEAKLAERLVASGAVELVE